MKDKSNLNYAKTHRKRSGLSQNELAFLFGDKSTSFVLKTERGNEIPCLSRALSYQIIFDTQAEEIFAPLATALVNRIFNNIIKLSKDLENQPETPSIKRKLNFLEKTARNIANKYSSV